MASLLLLTNALSPSADVLPALGLLAHTVRTAPLDATALLDAPPHDAVLVDARRDLVQARGLCRLLRTTGLSVPLLAVLTEGGLAGLSAEWGVDDVVLDSAGPAEVDARLRLAVGRTAPEASDPGVVRAGELTIDETTYTCRLRGRVLDLTFKEFELLKHLAQHPGRVFTRAQLLQEVWGYDYYGGTRTVDVHVRRLRAKLGAEHEQLIGTVRHVGYKFVTPPIAALRRPAGRRRPVAARDGLLGRCVPSWHARPARRTGVLGAWRDASHAVRLGARRIHGRVPQACPTGRQRRRPWRPARWPPPASAGSSGGCRPDGGRRPDRGPQRHLPPGRRHGPAQREFLRLAIAGPHR